MFIVFFSLRSILFFVYKFRSKTGELNFYLLHFLETNLVVDSDLYIFKDYVSCVCGEVVVGAGCMCSH